MIVKNNIQIAVRPLAPATAALDVKGEINANAEAALTEAHNQASAAGARNLLLNFSQLDYMNSSGIGLLVTLLIRARRQNQKLLACGLSDHYRQIFELTRLNEAISIYSNEAEALAATA
jgi:anti-sigma B factor antagonist